MTTTKALQQGARLGRYLLVRQLGRGGMGEVWEAEDPELGRRVAIKTLPEDRAESHRHGERLEREARSAAALSHPNVATLYSVERDGERRFLTMELIDGPTLAEVIPEGGLPVSEILRLGAALARAVTATHEAGLIHRDLKPANIMLSEGRWLKLLDLGLARRRPVDHSSDDMPTEEALTGAGAVIGTIPYMAPEQLAGRSAGASGDIWSLGVILFQMACGRLPFEGDSSAEIITAILRDSTPKLAQRRGELPQALVELIERCLVKKPGGRASSSAELAQELQRLADERQHSDLLTTAQAEARSLRWIPRWALTSLAMLGLVILGWAGLRWWSPSVAGKLDFASRDRVLILDVDDRTPDAAFGEVLRTALEGDLAQSQHALVIDRGTARRTLRTMKRDPAARIDEDLGAEIARFAGVRALLAPSISSVEETYRLEMRIIDPHLGATVAAVNLTVQGREAVLIEGIDALAQAVRARLGEALSSIEATDLPVVQHSTSSWEALRLLVEGREAWAARDFEAAAAAYQMALDVDPEFAAARGSLGLAQIQFLNQRTLGEANLATAVALAEVDATTQERLMLRALYRELVERDFEQALEDYRLLGRLYPQSPNARNNEGMVLRRMGRFLEATEAFERAIEDHPNDPVLLVNQWFTSNQLLGDPERALSSARKLVALDETSADARHSLGWTQLCLGHWPQSEANFRRAVELDPRSIRALSNLAHLLLARESGDEAEGFYRRVLELNDDPAGGRIDVTARYGLVLALERRGASEEARLLAQETATILEGLEPPLWASLVTARFRLDSLDEATGALIDSVLANDEASSGMTLEAASTLAALDEPEAALAALQLAMNRGWRDRYFARLMPELDILHGDPALEALITGQ